PLFIDATSLPRGKPLTLKIVANDVLATCPVMEGTGKDDRKLRLMVQSIRLSETVPLLFGGAVAHGAGRLNGAAITNSFDALQANITAFDTFEIDFNWTSDGELVCIHDWNESYANRFGDLIGALSHDDFIHALSTSTDRARNCDLDGLAGWMRANPDKRIVTDIKEDPIRGHELIARRHPDILGQFVPQAYQPEEIDQLRALGFEDVIWTLYRFARDEKRIVAEAVDRNPTAITMPYEWAITGTMDFVIAQTDLPVLVHTINDQETAACLKAMGASGVYSDDIGAQVYANMMPSTRACKKESQL
ncbi:MAG: hypothetical protein P8L32_01660, partial [Paracoccaceae bacterium]|nr:hypothetical protein [Paracoccaceae bacterium]